MANEVLYKVGGSPIIVTNSDYSPGASTLLGTRQAANDMDPTSLAAAAARQSTKLDFGATRAMLYDVRITFEIAADPTAGGLVNLYMSASHSGTANVGNMGLCTGADGAYAAAGGYTLAELLLTLQLIASVPVAVQNDGDGVQIAHAGVFSPTARYNNLVIVNNCSQAFHGDAVEFAVLFEPIATEVQ